MFACTMHNVACRAPTPREMTRQIFMTNTRIVLHRAIETPSSTGDCVGPTVQTTTTEICVFFEDGCVVVRRRATVRLREMQKGLCVGEFVCVCWLINDLACLY